jgi:hypothetical protein
MRAKIRSVLVAVALFGLGYAFHSVPVRADTDWSYEILQELRNIEGKLDGGSSGGARIYRVSTTLGPGNVLMQAGYGGSISGSVKGFACDKEDCYVVVQSDSESKGSESCPNKILSKRF